MRDEGEKGVDSLSRVPAWSTGWMGSTEGAANRKGEVD